MPMPSARACAGIVGRDRLAFPEHLALRLPRHAVDDLHQRRLAGAVFAEHRVDLAGHHREVDAVVGDDRRIDLADAAQLEARAPVGPRRRCALRASSIPLTAVGARCIVPLRRTPDASRSRSGRGRISTAHLQQSRRRPRSRSPRVPCPRCRRCRSGRSSPRNASAAMPRASSRRSNWRRFDTEPIRPK